MTSVVALASLAIVLAMQQQDVAGFNDKNNQGLTNSHIPLECTGGICLGTRVQLSMVRMCTLTKILVTSNQLRLL